MDVEKKVDFKIYADNYDNHRTVDLKLIDIAIESLKINTTFRILDFGCGTGNYLKALQKRDYINLFGVDTSDEMCKIAFEKTGAIIKNGSHSNIPFDNDYFDGILIVDVIHFINDIHDLLNEFHRISKTNGRIFIATQSHGQLESRIYSKYFPTTTEIDKIRHHNIDNIISVAESCGLSLVSVKDYLNNTDFLIDENYFNLIKNKSFYILGLISDNEFNAGIEKLQFDLKNGNFLAKFPGRTIITLEKK
jgi:ubiquinone/menaquinone biosynthesis C-methylase UbiE